MDNSYLEAEYSWSQLFRAKNCVIAFKIPKKLGQSFLEFEKCG